MRTAPPPNIYGNNNFHQKTTSFPPPSLAYSPPPPNITLGCPSVSYGERHNLSAMSNKEQDPPPSSNVYQVCITHKALSSPADANPTTRGVPGVASSLYKQRLSIRHDLLYGSSMRFLLPVIGTHAPPTACKVNKVIYQHPFPRAWRFGKTTQHEKESS